jgi:stearoyl-CoA desaturase (delta-9 desaturase)
MNIFQVTSKNRKQVQIFLRILTIVLIPIVNFSVPMLLTALIAYLFLYTIAHSIMLHRYYSHNHFQFKHNIIKWAFSLITIMSVRGSPIGWAYLHKLHHLTVDTEDDPHSPHYKKYKIFEIGDYSDIIDNINLIKVKHLLTKENLFISKYYWAICFFIPAIILFIDINMFYFLWLLPVCMFDILSTFFNYANHKKLIGSYENFKSTNTGFSVNNWLLWFVSLGEAWHNNHHYDPKSFSFKVKWWEFDPSAAIIRLVKK